MFNGVYHVLDSRVSLLNDTSGLHEQQIQAIQVCCSARSCPGDLNDNGDVELNDMLKLLSEWGPCDKYFLVVLEKCGCTTSRRPYW